MSKITYPNSSPYAKTPQSNWYLGLYAHRAIPATSNDQRITLSATYAHRPDRLSNDLYGTPVYWWVFAVRNPDVIRDPIWDFTAGKVIMAPAVEAVRALGG